MPIQVKRHIVDYSQGDQPRRRIFTRIPLSLEVTIRLDDINSFVSEYTSDLSVGGMFIKTRKPRKLGTEVNISINLQNGQNLIEATGRVVRVVLPGDAYTGAHPGMAIQFTDLSPNSRAVIEQYVEHKISELKKKS